jgi:hypothetical protein
LMVWGVVEMKGGVFDWGFGLLIDLADGTY